MLSAIRYLDSPTDYRECLPGQRDPGSFAESNFVVLDERTGFDWRGLRDLALIALMVSMILLQALRN